MIETTLGIDLASQAPRTAACLLAWEPGRARIRCLGLGCDDDALLALMLRGDAAGPAPARIGIDAPLGWPVAFVAAVADPEAWPLELPDGAFTRRLTDDWVKDTLGKTPLSVSTDRIAYPAMRAARLLRRYGEATGARIDRTGLAGPVLEAYPDTAVTRYGLRPAGVRRSYKAADGTEARAGLLARLLELAPWLEGAAGPEDDAWQRACVDSDDLFDALIAALIARSAQLGATETPPPQLDRAVLAREGWIHVPRPDGLSALSPV